ncbi:MAG: hypothetical protein ACRCTZ_05060 [Sarcina sp.]
MLSKLETTNLESKNFDFFSLIQKNELIEAPPYIMSIKEIISSIILLNIVDIEIEENKILFVIELKVKIVCVINDDSLHMINDNFLFFREVIVSKKIEGINIERIFKSNRLVYEALVIENQIIIFDNEKILLEVQGILGINYKRGFSIGMLIKTSEFEKNIYMCFENGRNIRQITFESNTEYSLMKWVKGKNFISYVKKVLDKDILCFYNMIENSENEILNFTKIIYEYTFIGNKKILLDCEVNDERNLYIYDMQEDDFYKMIKNLKKVNLVKPFYREDMDRIFFIKRDDESFRLCSIKSNLTNFDEVCMLFAENFFTEDDFSFVISFESQYILIYEIETKKEIRVKYPFGCLENLKFQAISQKKNIFMIAMDSGNEIFFYIFDSKSKKFKLVKCDRKVTKIGGMCFNDKGTGIFISIEILGMYNLYELDFNGKIREVLALHCDEFELFKR